MLSIVASSLEITDQIEWFDTEIDSILTHHRVTGKREFLNALTLPSARGCQESECHLPVNTECIDILSTRLNDIDIWLIGADFLVELPHLQKVANIHFAAIHMIDAHSLNVEIPEISNIQDFIAILRNNPNVEILTRYTDTVRTFLRENGLSHIPLQSVTSRQLESANIPENAAFPHPPMMLIADDIIGKIFVKKRKPQSLAKNLDLLISLTPGDYVVHRDHGVGKFVTILKKTLGDLEREYLEIHYADNDVLFVPITEIFRISKYLGNEGEVTLTRLGGKEWERTMSKTDEELRIIAENILETNARRQLSR